MNTIPRSHADLPADGARAAIDPGDPYRYIQVRGRTVGTTEENGLAPINNLSLRDRCRAWTSIADQTGVIYAIQTNSVRVA